MSGGGKHNLKKPSDYEEAREWWFDLSMEELEVLLRGKDIEAFSMDDITKLYLNDKQRVTAPDPKAAEREENLCGGNNEG